MVDRFEELQIRNKARNAPLPGDIPTYVQSSFVTLEPAEQVTYSFSPLSNKVFFLMWTEERFNPNTNYIWKLDGEKVDEGEDVHQSLGDQSIQFFPPEIITSQAEIIIQNLDTTSHTYSARFGGYQRSRDRVVDGIEVGKTLQQIV